MELCWREGRVVWGLGLSPPWIVAIGNYPMRYVYQGRRDGPRNLCQNPAYASF